MPLVFFLSGCRNGEISTALEAEVTAPGAPVAKRIDKELTIHGDTRIDEYYWLRERENPEVIEYLEAENEYTAKVMEHTDALQEKLFEEIVGRIPQEDASVPYLENGYWYYTRYEEGSEYPVYCRKKGTLEAAEEVLLEVNAMAEGYDYYRATGLQISPDNMILAFGVDTVSRRKYTIHFKDLSTGEILADEIPVTTGRVAWADDNKTVFYTLKDETLRPYKIASHRLGTDLSYDREIFHETDPTFNTYAFKSKSRRFILINSESTLSSEYRFLEANQPEGEFRIFYPREKDLEYEIEHYKDDFYIVTNYGAMNFRLMKAPVINTSKENWVEVIPHREDVLLQGIEIFERFLVVNERRDGLTRLRVIKWEDWSEDEIDFGEETYAAYIGDNPEFDTDLLRFEYSSLTTPNSTFDYDMVSGNKTLLKQEKVLGSFDPSDYHAERLYAVARDGVRVPISLVYRKGIARDGTDPLLLYGYGSYGASMNAYFRSDRLSILDRGFIYAIAHIRGGQEMGRKWYEDGKLLRKKNTFTDFIDCAEYLCSEDLTSPDRLYAMGASAGGLLVGAVVNMRPGLFNGVIAAVPWVDVVTTMLDESIPLTTSEYDEWGNPNEKDYYDYMLSYSPYDNVRAADYPAMLVTTGLHDSQVQYWEPAKWVARLRAVKTGDNILLLHTNMGAGHGGVSGRFRGYRETAMEFAFILDLEGINE
ncbi:MAG: S9 family peptidase [Candidatus Krumholzibacteriota bacterium]|nr:S9 family peptidase [Candidatus Krumholzibacteriota bacterium]